MPKHECSICGFVYDEEKKDIKWDDLPNNYLCPVCSAEKSLFKLRQEIVKQEKIEPVANKHFEFNNNLTSLEISAICSNLARGCEKQRKLDEMDAFLEMAKYFKQKSEAEEKSTLKDVSALLNDDLNYLFNQANEAAKENSDRGALRSLVWSEKVSAFEKTLLERFFKEGTLMLENIKIFVCDICGFIFIFSDTIDSNSAKLPDICPVCKVPNHKFIEIERR